MIKISGPRKPLKHGDSVIYKHPGHEDLSLIGVISGEYGDDRLLVTTPAGHTWALKLCDLFLNESVTSV